jgi:hypothetical protein
VNDLTVSFFGRTSNKKNGMVSIFGNKGNKNNKTISIFYLVSNRNNVTITFCSKDVRILDLFLTHNLNML